MKRTACALTLGVAFAAAGWSQAIDLAGLDFYVREGFQSEWVVNTPAEVGGDWVKVPAKPGFRAVLMRDIGLPGIPPAPFVQFLPSAPRHFTVSCLFTLEQSNTLFAASEGIALFLAHIGTNWEIYLNGYSVRKEMHVGPGGVIQRERSVRGLAVTLDKRFILVGKPNLLVFHLYGDPLSDRTGFNMGGPYVIDTGNAIRDMTNESVDLMFMGIYFFFALYHMILFFMRRQNRTYVIYGVATLVLTVYLFVRSYLVYLYVPDTFWVKIVEYFSFALLLPCFAAFFDSAVRGKVSLFTRLYGAFGLLCAVVMILPMRELGLKIYQYSLILALGYVFVWDLAIPLVRCFRDTWRTHADSSPLARAFWSLGHSLVGSDVGKLFLGTMVVTGTALVDLVASIAGYSIVTSRYGFLFLVFGAAAVLGSQFIKVYREVEDLNVTLEGKVEARTAELAKAMDEQRELNGELADTNGKLSTAMEIAAKDMRMAMHVQQGLFMRDAPGTDDWDIAFDFGPASGVSGDFYDFFVKGRSLKGMIVGDVSGHGIASAMITVLAKSIMFRRFNQGHGSSLGKIVETANHELVRELSSVDNYLTAVLLRFDGDKVEYVNAAHTEIFYRAAGKARAAILKPRENDDYKGLPLGCEGIESPYQAMKFSVSAGDSILVYTDCLNEARNVDGEEFGVEGIQSAYARAPEGDARQMLDFVMQEWRVHVGGAPVTDDLTVVLLKRKGR